MTAEIISVGTELLLGNILNTNAQYLSCELAKLGINVFYETVVGDNRSRILDAYKTAFSRAEIVIATGGLGPTDDDITKEAAAEYFGLGLEFHEPSWEKICNIFKTMHINMTPSNKKQAMLPVGCTILDNDNGTAPGCYIEQDGKHLFLLPGPPNELIPMYENSVAPILKQYSGSVFVSKTIKIVGIGESRAEDMLRDLIDAQENPTIAPYAKTSEVWFRTTASGTDESEARLVMGPIMDEIYNRFGENFYGEDDDSLEGVVVKLLSEKGLTLACAESCTGGGLTSRLVDFPGVSSVLLEGAVTYSNDAKVKRLGVEPETLESFGAVSSQTASEMAKGIVATSGADVGISTTGIAGPDGGNDEKPVGLVYIGLCIKGEVIVREYNFAGNRAKVRNRAVVTALDTLRRELLARN